jgi:hypothetical protein
MKLQLGATDLAGVGLGVEAAIAGIVIFLLTVVTKGEPRHGGEGAIIGKGLDNAISRAAVGAVDEGIAVAAIVGVKQFFDAVGTGGEIRENQGGFPLGMGFGGLNDEVCLALGGDLLAMEAINLGVGRKFNEETLTELFELGAIALNFDHNSVSGIGNPARYI